MRRSRAILLALFVVAEGLTIWSYPDAARAVLRTVYDTLWYYAPKPEGYVPPHRF